VIRRPDRRAAVSTTLRCATLCRMSRGRSCGSSLLSAQPARGWELAAAARVSGQLLARWPT
jgi:hypothetical protein